MTVDDKNIFHFKILITFVSQRNYYKFKKETNRCSFEQIVVTKK